jgi:hypothetical protein
VGPTASTSPCAAPHEGGHRGAGSASPGGHLLTRGAGCFPLARHGGGSGP